MINNAYLVETLANYYDSGITYEGTAMRRASSVSPIDSIPFDLGNVPASAYWNYYRTKGIHILKDNTPVPIVYFTPQFITINSFTSQDFSILLGGATRAASDVFVFNDKVTKPDITCKNGYVHVLQSVLVPPVNMAQFIENNSNANIPTSLRTSIFSKLVDRFCAPYFDASNTVSYRLLHPTFTDSIFVKHYFSSIGGTPLLPSGVLAPNLLPFDPGWNSYQTSALPADMGAMFVPSDDAMNAYFNSGVGALIKNRFGSWDNVPDGIVRTFIARHMRTSLIQSIPSRFSKMVDAEDYPLPVTTSDIQNTYTAVNGEVFVTSKVYTPVDYISVYGPVLFNADSQIMNWAINTPQTAAFDKTQFAFYKLYLNSLENTYSLFIPTDEDFNNNYYIDPISYGQDIQGALKFKYNNLTSSVTAYKYTYNKTSGIVGSTPYDSIVSTSTSATDFVRNRLLDMLNSHIVIGSVETGNNYYVTKANDIINVVGSGTSMIVKGGGDIANGTSAQVTTEYNQQNGNTYFLNKAISPSLRSVYNVLSQTPEFSAFYNLLAGVPVGYASQIFTQQGMDYDIQFFNAFRYTVYVPSNDAVQKAITAGIITPWETIYAMTDVNQQNAATDKMIQFLKYHFQDNAVFVGQAVNAQYQSSSIKTDTISTYWGTANTKFFQIGVNSTGNSLTLTMDSKSGGPTRTVNVLTSDPVTGNKLYNIIAKDYIFGTSSGGSYTNKSVKSVFANIDGTGSGQPFSTSNIVTSASTVIHEIDTVMTFE